MRKWLVLLFGCVWLASCQVSLNPVATHHFSGCDMPGTVQMLTLEDTRRGYPYNFGVYLPPCYESQAGQQYPLLIHIPGRGGSPEEFLHAGGIALVDELILAEEIPPFILVMTENTDSDAEKNGESIWNDLIPYIEQQYRVRSERRFHSVLGVSLGGVATYRLAFQHPEYFSSGALFGSGAIAGEEDQIRAWLAVIDPEYKLRMFFDSGQGDPYMLARARVMADLLNEAGIQVRLHTGDGDHSYTYWMQVMPTYFHWLVTDWE